MKYSSSIIRILHEPLETMVMRKTLAFVAMLAASPVLFGQYPGILAPVRPGPPVQAYVPPVGANVNTPLAIQQALRANRALFFYAAFADSYHSRYMAPFLSMVAQRPAYGETYYQRYFKQFEPAAWSQPESVEPQYIVADGPIATRPNQAQVTLEVPPLAKVWVEGTLQEFRGTAVRVVSPELTPKRDYVYAVKVTWPRDKSTIERTFEVSVRAGDRTVLTVVDAGR